MPDAFDSFTVYAPASSANLGPGFDCLGLSLPLYTSLRAAPQAVTEVCPLGETLLGTPADERNYVYRAMQLVARRVGRLLPPARLGICSEVPLARGLGSSAAALVAVLTAGNEMLGRPLSAPELLDLAAREEGHPDNVAAALRGGIAVTAQDERGTQALRLPPPPFLGVTVFIPDFELSTAEARAALPEQYSRADAAHALAHAALLTAALATGELALLRHAMRDRLHQSWRALLVPGLSDILEGATQHGALGAALSGAGPTALCFHDQRASTAPMHAFLREVAQRRNLSVRILDLPIDERGTWVEWEG